MARDSLAELEGLAFRAWPAAEVLERGGWRLRFTSGVTRRANSVWPGPPAGTGADLDTRVDEALAFYAARGCPPRFQVSPWAEPAGLDEALAARGFEREAPVSVQVADTERVALPEPGGDLAARTTEAPSEEWLALAVGRSRFAAVAPVFGGILERLGDRAGYAWVRLDGAPVGVGLGVVEGGWCGVFHLLTVPEARRRGAARAVLAALAGWARTRGARRLYLQVERANAAALALHRGAGFREAYGYHYRLRSP